MAPVTNERVLFMSIPSGEFVTILSVHTNSSSGLGYPAPGKTTVYDDTNTIDLENVKLNGGFLVKTLYLSVDPYFRSRMREPHIESYLVGSNRFKRSQRH